MCTTRLDGTRTYTPDSPTREDGRTGRPGSSRVSRASHSHSRTTGGGVGRTRPTSSSRRRTRRRTRRQRGRRGSCRVSEGDCTRASLGPSPTLARGSPGPPSDSPTGPYTVRVTTPGAGAATSPLSPLFEDHSPFRLVLWPGTPHWGGTRTSSGVRARRVWGTDSGVHVDRPGTFWGGESWGG